MKTIINSHGCSTHPNESPALEIDVPTTVQGVDFLEELRLLQTAVEGLAATVASLKQSLVAAPPAASTKSQPEAPAVSVETQTVEPAVGDDTAPAKGAVKAKK